MGSKSKQELACPPSYCSADALLVREHSRQQRRAGPSLESVLGPS